MQIRAAKGFAKQLNSFKNKYPSLRKKVLDLLEDVLGSDTQDQSAIEKLKSAGLHRFKMSGGGSGGLNGVRIVVVKDDDGRFIPSFIGKHNEYEKYIARVESNKDGASTDIRNIREGQNTEIIDTDDFRQSVPTLRYERACLIYGEYVSPMEGNTVIWRNTGIELTESELEVFNKISFDFDTSQISESSIRNALDALKTAKELVDHASKESEDELVAAVDEFHEAYHSIDETIKTEIRTALGLSYDKPDIPPTLAKTAFCKSCMCLNEEIVPDQQSDIMKMAQDLTLRKMNFKIPECE